MLLATFFTISKQTLQHRGILNFHIYKMETIMNIFPNKIYQCILVRYYTTSEVSISILLDSFLNKSIYQSRTA